MCFVLLGTHIFVVKPSTELQFVITTFQYVYLVKSWMDNSYAQQDLNRWVGKDSLKLNNARKTFFNKPEQCFNFILNY